MPNNNGDKLDDGSVFIRYTCDYLDIPAMFIFELI